MEAPYDQFDSEIRNLIRQGCTTTEASQQLLTQYPQLVNQYDQLLKQVQAVERNLRRIGH
jgi:hypothetical protein